MLYNCSNSIPGNLVIPSFYPYEDNQYFPLNVSIGLVINNFISVDDVNSQITMDFWYRNIWNDPRINLPPETWSYLNPIALVEGLDITQYIASSQVPLEFWLPDLVFYEGVDISELAQMIKLFPNGTIFWSRHFLVTLTDADMNLLQYPLDAQNFSMTFQSYAYCSKLLLIDFMPSPVSFNYDTQAETNYVNLNQLWTYLGWSAYTMIVNSPVIFNPHRQYSTAFINLHFQRQSFGIVYRLGLPIAMFLVLVGFSFWANIDKRIDVTLQMLLVVAALYLVIGQIIPFVGYFTRMDLYITTAFLVLIVTTGIHFCSLLLERKKQKYPANVFLGDCLVYFFRVIWIPFALLIFIVFFQIVEVGILSALCIATVISFSNAYLNRKYLTESLKVAVLNLREKERFINEANLSLLQQQSKRLNEPAAAGMTTTTMTMTTNENVKQTEDGYVRKVKQLTFFENFLLKQTRKYYVNRLYRNRQSDMRGKSMRMLQQLRDESEAPHMEEKGGGGQGFEDYEGGEFEMTSFSRVGSIGKTDLTAPSTDNPLYAQSQVNTGGERASEKARGSVSSNQFFVDSDDED